MTLPQAPVAVLLDFDGVIVDSVALKIQAYFDVYEDATPAQRERMSVLQRRHGGITRRIKFEWFEREIFGRTPTDAELDRLAAAYATRVHAAVIACPLIAGALEFLDAAHSRSDLHVVSGTPQDELRDIVERRGLARYFRSVSGAPETKPAAFARILATHDYPAARVVAIGDAITEFDAAERLGVAFLGITDARGNPFASDVAVLPTMEGAAARLGFD